MKSNSKNHPSIQLHYDDLPLNIFPLIPIQTLTLTMTISSPSLNSTPFIKEQNCYFLFSETFYIEKKSDLCVGEDGINVHDVVQLFRFVRSWR
ncbi:hypothetical protein RYX36_005761 [Vicia faba]